MNLILIAWRSVQQRGLASLLTCLSMALGVTLVVAVLTIYGVIEKSFASNSSLGYNMIVGGKGGRLQLTLNTVFYLSTPIEPIPYSYYLEFKSQQERDAELKHSLDEPESRSGLYDYCSFSIPVCLGDYFGRFRVVGTTPDMFEKLRFGPEADRQFKFSQGENFRTWSDKYGYYECVIGATVAREMAVKVGDTISPAHGDPEGAGHAEKFTIVGVLAPSGTPNDRGVFVNIEGFYLMENHARPLKNEDGETDATAHRSEMGRLPVEQREVSAILLLTKHPLMAIGLEQTINEDVVAQAVTPVSEIYNLFGAIVQPIQRVLLGLTAMICVVSGISILVSIYNSMSDRRHEIAVIRALGAGRSTVMSIILLESGILSVCGGLIGWTVGHLLNWLASPIIEQRTGVRLAFWDFAPPVNIVSWISDEWEFMASPELMLIPSLLILAILVGFLPAMSAYRTDVAKSLDR